MKIKSVSSDKSNKEVERHPSFRTDEYDDWDSRFTLRSDHDDFGYKFNEIGRKKHWFKPSCIPITLILVIVVLVVLLPLIDAADKQNKLAQSNAHKKLCLHNCSISLVESIPEGLTYENWTDNPSTFSIWKKMIDDANDTIEIGSFYWTLRNDDVINDEIRNHLNENIKYPGSSEGEEIFDALMNAGISRGIEIKIAQSQPTQKAPNLDTELLIRKKAAQVRSVDMGKLVGGSGVLHTKLWIVDGKEAYVGSANMDWRSLTQVKELGVHIKNCPCLVKDIRKIFQIYWLVGEPDAKIPDHWPEKLDTNFNIKDPMHIYDNSSPASVFVSSSPPKLCTKGRTSDIDSILYTIKKAEKFVYISVMDYMPLMIYQPIPKIWPVIDDALKEAAVDRRVEVRLLISKWNHTRQAELTFLRSLQAISGVYKNVKITVKLFSVPSTKEQSKIPFARVNHNKYMVTDNIAYIGTSNWCGDYFVDTAGTAVIVEGETELRQQLEQVFLRDWNSKYSYSLV